MSQRQKYPSDLQDLEWVEVEPLLPVRRDERGAKEQHSRRDLLDAIFYVCREGIRWSALPNMIPIRRALSFRKDAGSWNGRLLGSTIIAV